MSAGCDSPAELDVSIIILNHDNSARTGRCVESIWAHTQGVRYEIVVVDNGSSAEEFRKLISIPGKLNIVRLNENRFFGEGNNIGAQNARGRHLLFMSNDVLVTSGWLIALLKTLRETKLAGAAGPKCIGPDDRTLECGAFIDDTGNAIPLGRTDATDPEWDESDQIVDYCSAACLLVSRAVFEEVRGFDLYDEPGRYDDVDLCLKIAALGLMVYYCPAALIVRNEDCAPAASCDRLESRTAIDINKQKFLDRWDDTLRKRAASDFVVELPRGRKTIGTPARRLTATTATRPTIAFYSPYTMIPGGGERYLLSAMSAALDIGHVTLFTAGHYSDMRILSLGETFGLDLTGIRCLPIAHIGGIGTIDCFVMMGNEVLPALRGPSKSNIFICQFPFPVADDVYAERWGNLEAIDRIVVYSPFVRRHLVRQLCSIGKDGHRIDVISPPVELLASGQKRDAKNPCKILLVGRFYEGGHNKRHDIAIEAARRLVDQGVNVELHLAGSVHTEQIQRDHYQRLVLQGANLPVTFHPDASRDRLIDLFRSAHIYWHATGFDVSSEDNPERCEHFGISPLEAMSAGCVPLVFSNGGPTEYVEDGKNGYVYSSIDELVRKTRHLISDDNLRAELSDRALKTSKLFHSGVFFDKWSALLREAIQETGRGIR